LCPNSEADAAPASCAAAIGRWLAIAGRGPAARGDGSRRGDWVGGGELSPCFCCARGRGRGGSDRALLLLLLPSGSTRCCSCRGAPPRRAFAGRSACRVRTAGVQVVFDGAGAGGCRPAAAAAAAEEVVVVRGCWQLLGWAWCCCRGCSPFRLGLDVVVLVR